MIFKGERRMKFNTNKFLAEYTSGIYSLADGNMNIVSFESLSDFPEGCRYSKGYYVSIDTRPRVVCQDGFSISIQANEYLYCRPRYNVGPYSKVELGYPSKRDSLIIEYADVYLDDSKLKSWVFYDAPDQLTNIIDKILAFIASKIQKYEYHMCETKKDYELKSNWVKVLHFLETPHRAVYSYVPVGIVDALIEKHGGFSHVDLSNTKKGANDEN
jgi:hypothetical protein